MLPTEEHRNNWFVVADANLAGPPPYEFGPFGEVLRGTGPLAKANPFRFSTQYQDDESDIVWYPYRPYSASFGRWLSRDPLEEQASRNLYVFVGNNPISAVDAFGLWGSSVQKGVKP